MDISNLDLNILKTIITNSKYALDFAQEGSEQLFHPDLWRFAKTVLDYIRVYKEVPTKRILIEKLKTSKQEALSIYVDKIFTQLEEHKYNELEFKPELEKLKLRYQDKLIEELKASLEKEHNLQKNISSIQSSLISIKNISSKRVYAQSSLRDGVESFVERFKARKSNPEIEKGIFTGFTVLDNLNNGFKAPEYVIIGGGTGAGKSTLLLSLAAGIYLQGNSILEEKYYGDQHSIIYYSLEMPLEECQDRLISNISQVPIKDIKSTKLTPEQETRLNKTLRFLKKHPGEFEIVDIPKGATSMQLESIYNDYCARKKKPTVIVVDYLNIMETESKDIENDWLKQAEISEELYKFARVNNLILLTGVQLNESGKPEKSSEGNIGTHRIGRSKGILFSSTMAMLLEKRIGEENHPTMNVHLIKNRRGPLGKLSVRKNLECCSFLNDIGYTGDDISEAMKRIEGTGI